jgi:hypothetical protein
MYKLLFIALFSTLLSAQNPKPFSALGDAIYNNVDKIEKLKYLEEYKYYKDDIEKYVEDVKKAKKKGFDIELGKYSDKKDYLNNLRDLSKRNDYFFRKVKSDYDNSIEKEDSKLFLEMINSGLIDTKKYKKEIIDYYFEHLKDINATGVIKKFLEEDARLKAKKEAQRKRYKSKKEKELEKIKRIRENDKREQEKLERKLQEELIKKKLEIREHQKKELSI